MFQADLYCKHKKLLVALGKIWHFAEIVKLRVGDWCSHTTSEGRRCNKCGKCSGCSGLQLAHSSGWPEKRTEPQRVSRSERGERPTSLNTKPARFHLKQKYAKRNQRNTYNGITRNILHRVREILVWWSESRPVRGERARVPHAASNKTGPLASTCRNILNRIREIQCGQSSLAQSQRWGSDLQPHRNTVSV